MKPFREESVANGAISGEDNVVTNSDLLIENEMANSDADPLVELDVTQWLVFKEEDDSPALRGGHPDALIVLATQANDKGKALFSSFLLSKQ